MTTLTAARLSGPLSLLVGLAAWILAARLLEGTFLLAGPGEVLVHAWEMRALLGRALAVTLKDAAWGYLIGNLAGVALAFAALLAPRAQPVIAGLALIVFCLPLVATGPILRVLFGPGSGPQITLAALAVFYTTFVPMLTGLRAAPADWFDLVRSYGRGRLTELHHVRLFASLPYLVAGLQIAAPAAFLGAMIGEFTGAERGIGVLAIRAMRSLDVTATWTLAAIAASVSILAYLAVGWIGRQLTHGRPAVLLARAVPEGRPSAARTAAVAAITGMAATALWWGLMELADLNRFFAKRPGDVWDFLVLAPDAASNRQTLFLAMGETMILAVPGYLAGLLLGACLAALVILFPAAAALALPMAVALRSVPIVTTAPLIVLALGRGAVGTITIVAVMIFFPTLVACLQGLRQAPGQVLDVFDSYGAGRWSQLFLARLPTMLPAFFASARMAVPAALLAVTVAEWLATGTGIGNLMALTASTSAYAMLWSATALVAVVAALSYAAIGALETAVLRVYAPEQLRR